MSAQPITQQIRWQDFKVRNEIDSVLEIAYQEGWEDCEIFGYGDMITEPLEVMGWKLIPADLYEYSIPTQGIGRLKKIIDAGVRIQGVIIADDERSLETSPTPDRPKITLPSDERIVPYIKIVLRGLIDAAAAIASISIMASMLIFTAPIVIPMLIRDWVSGTGTSSENAFAGYEYDPILVILVDGGEGTTVWVSLFIWWE
jgi:hypothetical protein